MPKRYFTPQEANAALDLIRPLVEEIQAIRKAVLERSPDLWPALERSAGNGGSSTLSRLAQEFERLDQLVHAILEAGAEIKDLSTGLLDFPAWRADHAVYLCWKRGEQAIEFWHEIEAGFAGRQPIETF
jgi:hypothetical protein